MKKMLTAAALLLLMGGSAVHAQDASSGATATDVKPGDWAYDAVQDLAAKGLIKGYPPDGNFLGGRALTRFEMATIIDRVLDKMNDLAGGPGSAAQGLGTQVTETQQLVDQFKVELTIIGSRLDTDEASLKTLQGEVSDLQQGLGSAYDAIEDQSKRTDALKKQVKTDEATTYSSNSKSKFNISGYIQFRTQIAASNSKTRYPQGSSAVAGPYNGNYAQGGVGEGAQVRRARLRFFGSPTANTTYAAQLDYSGATSVSSTSIPTTPTATTVTTSNQQITLREAWGAYTFGDGTTAYPTITAGQFATPFGYALPISTSAILTPERPLAFSEGSTYGLFNSQDYDKGIKASYSLDNVTLCYAAINGSGRQNENVDGHLDSVVRLAYGTADKQYATGPSVVSVGTSYYDGYVYRTRPAYAAVVTTVPSYQKPKKDLLGFDAQVNLKNGVFADAEYVSGRYESRSYFATQNAASISNDTYVKGNTVQGYYVWGGYTFAPSSTRPLTLAADYDVFLRSKSAQDIQSNATGVLAPTSGNSSYDDVNFGAGALYNLDKATRLRFWYDTPKAVAHAPGTPTPPHIGLYTVEMQFKY